MNDSTIEKQLRKYIVPNIFAMLGISCYILVGMFCPGAVLQLMGADEEILATRVTYLRIALLFASCFMLNFTFTAFVRNDYAPKLAMALLACVLVFANELAELFTLLISGRFSRGE